MSNVIAGQHSGVVAGTYNIVTSSNSFIGGGSNNQITNSASRSFIGGGQYNFADGLNSFIGGYANTTTGNNATAFGYQMQVDGNYSFGINVSSTNPATITNNNTIALMGGNVGVGTTTPETKLTIDSTVGAGLFGGISLSGGGAPTAILGHANIVSNHSGVLALYNNTPAELLPPVFIPAWTKSAILHGLNIGTTSYSGTGLLNVGLTQQFRVDNDGDIARIKNISYDWPDSQGAVGTILQNNGAGALYWTATSSLGFVDTDTTTSPAGFDGYIQFNEDGEFAASQNLYWATSTGRLGVGDASIAGSPTNKLSIGATPSSGSADGMSIYGDDLLTAFVGNYNSSGVYTGRIGLYRAEDADTELKTFISASASYFVGGNVGIGVSTTIPSLLTVGSNSGFQVNSSGNLTKINNVTYSWPGSQGAASTILQNDGSGTLTWVNTSTLGFATSSHTHATLSQGTGIAAFSYNGSSAATVGLATSGVTAGTYGTVSAVPILVVDTYGRITSASTSSIAISASQITSGILPIARGGTNSSTIGAAGSVPYSDATSYRFTAVGTSGQILRSNGAGAPTWVSTSTLGITVTETDPVFDALPAAKGDIFTATANDTPSILSVGTNGKILTASSSATNGIDWMTTSSLIGTLGTMAYQNANNVNISGGTITSIGDVTINEGQLYVHDNLYITDGDSDTVSGIYLGATEVGQYFITSAGTAGQLWSSDGDGRGTWVATSSLGIASAGGWTDDGMVVRLTTIIDNVGIGTTTPAAKLHVNITTGDGIILGSGSSGSAVAKLFANGDYGDVGNISLHYGSSQKALLSADGVSYLNGGNVGIGTTSPAAKLHVNITTGDGIILGSGSSGSAVAKLFANGDYGDVGNISLHYGSSQKALLSADGVSYLNGGNVGIGTTSPAAKLHVNITTGDGIILGSGSSGSAVAKLFANGDYGDVGNISLHYGSSQKALLSADGVSYLNGGNVGIGTTSPSYSLSVAGHMAVTGTFRVGNSQDAGASGYILRSNGSSVAPTWVATSSLGLMSTALASAYIWVGNASGVATAVSMSSDATISNTGALTISANAVGSNEIINNSIAPVDMASSSAPSAVGNVLTYNGSNFKWIATSSLGIASAGGWTDDGTVVRLTAITDSVGIGTTTPPFKLAVQAGYNDGITLYSPTAVGTIGMVSILGGGGGPAGVLLAMDTGVIKTRISADASTDSYFDAGDVGIGTTTPSNKLQVNVTSNNDGILLSGNSTLAAKLYYDGSSGHIGYMSLYGGGAETVKLSASGYSYINGGNVGIGTTTPPFKLAVQAGYNDGITLYSPTAVGTIGMVSILGGGGGPAGVLLAMDTGVTKIRISADASTDSYFNAGDVGIGTTTPAGKLHVLSSASDGILLSGTDDNKIAAKLHHTYMSGATAGLLSMYDNTVQKIYLNAGGISYLNGGNVGIGTTSPAYKLTVAGDLHVTGTLRVGNNFDAGITGYLLMSNGSSLAPSWTSTATLFSSAGGWTDDGTIVRLTTLGDKVGINTYSAFAPLHVGDTSNDGTIVAKGLLGSGYSLNLDQDQPYFVWSSKRAALRAGISGSSLAWDDAYVGNYSVAMGYYSAATGTASVAIGGANIATADYATALGYNMTVSGARSFGVNVSTTAATLSQADTIALMGGNVGVGKVNPERKLDVSGVARIQNFASLSNVQYDAVNINYTMLGNNIYMNEYSGVPYFAYLNTDSGGATGYSGMLLASAGFNFYADVSSTVKDGVLSDPNKLMDLLYDGQLISYGTYSVGDSLTASGAGTRMIWFPKKSAFRAGTAEGTEYNDANIGNYSFAGGSGNLASGESATAFGSRNTASGQWSFIAGSQNTASNTASIALGRSNNATGIYSFTAGYGNTASGIYSVAIGRSSVASEEHTTALGYNATASGEYATALGYQSTASFYGASAFGFRSVASSFYSLALGNTVTSSGSNAVAMGSFITVSGSSSLGINVSSTVPATLSQNHTIALMGGNVGVGTVTPSEQLAVWGDMRVATTTGTAPALYVDVSANAIGVRMIAPQEALHVEGNIRIPGTGASDGYIKMDANRYIHSYGGTTNFFAGVNAGGLSMTGDYNTGVGASSLNNITSGQNNVALGYYASRDLQTGSDNVAVGVNALFNATGYSANVAVGKDAMAETTANSSTAVGYEALSRNTSGEGLVAVGYQALTTNSTGNYNSALGYQALYSNTTGLYNTAFGSQTLYDNVSAHANTALGWGALANTTNASNTAVGFGALITDTTGYSNTAVGLYALRYVSSGSYNVAIGLDAGDNSVFNTESYNTLIGARADVSADAISNSTAIGYDAVVGSSNRVVLGNGDVTSVYMSDDGGASVYFTPASTLYTTALCWDNSGPSSIYDCNGSATDYMEYYAVDNDVESGDLVVIGDTYVSTTEGFTIAKLEKATGPYDPKLLGVISIKEWAGDFNSIGQNSIYESDNPHVLALSGRIPVKVTTDNGPIYKGDKLTSSDRPGYAMKATEDGPTIGIALADFTGSATGTVMVFIDLGWNNTIYRGLTINESDSEITFKTPTLAFTTTTYFTSSVSSTPDSRAFIFNALNFDTTSTDKYILSLRSNNNPVFSVSSNGDVHSSGNMYAASAVLGTSTNPGDLAEKVDINPSETVEAGDVMMVDPASPDRYQKSNQAYEPTVAGVISTNPTIIVGNGKTDQTAPLAMVGRVPVKFSEENGAIQRGDLLVSASTPGYAMKYDPILDNSRKVVGIIGIALDNSMESTNGKVMTLIRTGWVYNKTQAVSNLEQQVYYVASSAGVDLSVDPELMNIETTSEGSITYNSDSNLSLNNFSITNVKSIISTNNKWTIDENGILISKIITAEGAEKNIYGMTSESAEITLSGTGTLQMGEIFISFATDTKSIIDELEPIKVSVTLTSIDAKGIAVIEKSNEGFKVKELDNGTSNATFDWIVIAKRRAIINESSSEPETIDTKSSSGSPVDESSVDEELTQAGEEDETTDSSSSPAGDSFEEPLAEEPPADEEPSLEETLPAPEPSAEESTPEEFTP